MSRYMDNISLLAIGFAFASICTGVFGSVILSVDGSTMGNTFFLSGIFFFLIFFNCSYKCSIIISILMNQMDKKSWRSRHIKVFFIKM
jgi:hypothetical protein